MIHPHNEHLSFARLYNSCNYIKRLNLFPYSLNHIHAIFNLLTCTITLYLSTIIICYLTWTELSSKVAQIHVCVYSYAFRETYKEKQTHFSILGHIRSVQVTKDSSDDNVLITYYFVNSYEVSSINIQKQLDRNHFYAHFRWKGKRNKHTLRICEINEW